jgi:hypothetical protein
MIDTRLFLLLTLLFGASGAAQAQDTPHFIAVTVAGPRAPAPLLQTDNKGVFHFGGTTPFRVAAEDLVELRSATHNPPLFPRQHFALLANGDWVPLDPAGRVAIAEERVQLNPVALGGKTDSTLSLSQSALALLAFEPPEIADDPAQAWADFRKLQPVHDLLLRRDGETFEGTLTRVDDHVRLRRDNRQVDVPVAEAAGVLFNRDLRAQPRLRQPHVQVTLRNGARLTLANLALDAEQGVLSGTSPYGATMEFPLQELVDLQPHLGRVVYLSALTPVRWKHTPFLDVVHPLARDSTRSGRPLEIGGVGHRYGLALPCRGEAAYQLNGAYRWFEATVGVHPADGAGGVRFAVLVDGKEVAADTVEQRAGRPAAVRADVAGARTLTLISDFASRGNVQSEAIWGSARLLR